MTGRELSFTGKNKIQRNHEAWVEIIYKPIPLLFVFLLLARLIGSSLLAPPYQKQVVQKKSPIVGSLICIYNKRMLI